MTQGAQAVSHSEQQTCLPDLIALYKQGRLQELLERATGFPLAHPDAGAVCNIVGAAHVGLGQNDAAITMFDQAIRLVPSFAIAHYNRGNVLHGLKRLDEAVASFDAATRYKPDYAEAYYNRGNALRDLGKYEAAVASFDKALQFAPDHPGAHNNRGVALQNLGQLDEAIASFDHALQIDPGIDAALSQMLHLRAQVCDWSSDADPSLIGLGGSRVPPLAMLALDDDPERQLKRSQAQVSVQTPPIVFAASRRPGRLRIGYFSADFHNHATMSLLAGMLEKHDRARFDVHAFSYGPHSEDRARSRLCAAVEHFHEVGDMSDQQIAASAREHEIDIAIDLKGYTQGGRPEIFAFRAAPVQMAYLGFPGTMGQPFIDYVIADRIVAPDPEFFAEKLIHLPDSYQVNDDRRTIGDPTYRMEQGLPEQGFVFCCFNNSYKISPVEFDIWARLLHKVEGSVLWLLKGNHWVEANLRREAAARGIESARLIFADRLPEAEHLARQRCADLFLDTFKCNAHTTASDALWAGLPVLTMTGRSFAARVATSLLHAVGLPELATATPEAYEHLALELATDPERLTAVRTKLTGNRATAPLFDTERFTRNIERAYEAAFERYVAGLAPEHLAII